jgi:hypothetical protein
MSGDSIDHSHLGNAVALAVKQDQIVWTIFGIFWAANAVLLVALFNSGALPKRGVGLMVSLAGVVLSTVWFLVERRIIGYLHFYEAIVERIELELRVPSELALSASLNKGLHKVKVGQGVKIEKIILGCATFSGVLWLVSIVLFLIHL